MTNTTVYIKNMVCNRCIYVVEQVLQEQELDFSKVELGVAHLAKSPTVSQKKKLEVALVNFGFEILKDQKEVLVDQIKKHLIKILKNPTLYPSTTLSKHLQQQFQSDYSKLNTLFKASEGIAIEQFWIQQKVALIKEWLTYGELQVSEMAVLLHYSSTAHLSAQFKKVTGLSPSAYKNLPSPTRETLDKI